MSCVYPTVYIPIGSQVVVTFDMTERLFSTEVLTGTPTVVDEDSTGDLTISSKQVNTVAYTSEDIAIGKAVQFKISSSTTTEETYTLNITAESNGTPVQTLTDTMKVVFQD